MPYSSFASDTQLAGEGPCHSHKPPRALRGVPGGSPGEYKASPFITRDRLGCGPLLTGDRGKGESREAGKEQERKKKRKKQHAESRLKKKRVNR